MHSRMFMSRCSRKSANQLVRQCATHDGSNREHKVISLLIDILGVAHVDLCVTI